MCYRVYDCVYKFVLCFRIICVWLCMLSVHDLCMCVYVVCTMCLSCVYVLCVCVIVVLYCCMIFVYDVCMTCYDGCITRV